MSFLRYIATTAVFYGICSGTGVNVRSIIFAAPFEAPSAASDVVSHDFASFSWPAHWFTDFAGNASHPNRFSMDVIDLLANKSGAQPFIRVGGTST